MIAADYYWTKAAEALERADAVQSLSNCIVSIALVYRSLADSEKKLHRCFPDMPPPSLGNRRVTSSGVELARQTWAAEIASSAGWSLTHSPVLKATR